MIIHLYDTHGMIGAEVVNTGERQIELTAPAQTVKINLKPYPVHGSYCILPQDFEWDIGANSVSVIDAAGNSLFSGLIIRSTAPGMKVITNTHDVLIHLSDGLYSAKKAIQEQAKVIEELKSYCTYPTMFKTK